MSSFPDVISTTISVTFTRSDHLRMKEVPGVFTVPSQYAFAVVQVCFSELNQSFYDGKLGLNTSHGIFYMAHAVDKDYVSPTNNSASMSSRPPVSTPILNLIIKGGESFTIGLNNRIMNNDQIDRYKFSTRITALCHKKPS